MRFKPVLAIMFLAANLAIAQPAGQTGLQIMQTEEQKYNAQTESYLIEMALINGSDEQADPHREISMWMWLQNNNQLQSSLIKLTGPADLKNTGVLTIQQSVSQTSQMLFLPGLNLSRQIVANNKADKFILSDITYGDLEPEVLPRWIYQLQADQVIDGFTCYVIEATPADQQDIQNYGYNKRIIYIRQDNHFVVKIDYHDQEGQLSKIQYNQQVVQINGYWRANKIIVHNLLADHLTVLTFSQRQINPQLPQGFFSKRYLELSIEDILRRLR
ncbi:outer membrane lipoprotein-sorting protein [Patescibacteria group bacterium]